MFSMMMVSWYTLCAVTCTGLSLGLVNRFVKEVEDVRVNSKQKAK